MLDEVLHAVEYGTPIAGRHGRKETDGTISRQRLRDPGHRTYGGDVGFQPGGLAHPFQRVGDRLRVFGEQPGRGGTFRPLHRVDEPARIGLENVGMATTGGAVRPHGGDRTCGQSTQDFRAFVNIFGWRGRRWRRLGMGISEPGAQRPL